jgi:hypothetical protein
VEIEAQHKVRNNHRVLEGLESDLPILLCSHVTGEGCRLPGCVLAKQFQPTWR